MSTSSAILEYLQQGFTLTKIEAMYYPFRTTNLGDKILRLRREGYPIEKRWKTTPEGKRFAEYYLERTAQ